MTFPLPGSNWPVTHAKLYGPTGLTGATAASRYVGATTGGPPNTGTFDVGDFVLDQTGGWFVCTVAGSPGSWVAGGGNDYWSNQQLASGECVFPRIGMGTGAVMVSGTMYLSYWTAAKTEVVNELVMNGEGTAAGATPTYCAFGIYSVDGSGNLTLQGVTANDTTIFSTTYGSFTRVNTTPFTKVAGQRYAFASLVVSSFSMPNAAGYNGTMLLAAVAPRITGTVSGQTSIPASVTAANVSNSSSAYWGAVTP